MKRLIAGAGIGIGILFLGFILFVLALAALPRSSRFRTEEFHVLRTVVLGVLNLLEGGKVVTNPPDSPIVVRGGSMNIFSNNSNSRWQATPNTNYMFQADLKRLPNIVFMDGIAQGPPNTDPVTTTLQTNSDWAITLTFRNNGSASSRVNICTSLTTDSKGKPTCILKPATTLSGNLVYFEAGHSDIVQPGDIDRPDPSGSNLLHARVHYTVPFCRQFNPANTYPYQDIDPTCDKISQVTVWPGSSHGTPDTYNCVDGACDFKINHQ